MLISMDVIVSSQYLCISHGLEGCNGESSVWLSLESQCVCVWGGLPGGLSRSCWLVGKSVGSYLDCVNCSGKTEGSSVEGTVLQPEDPELSGDSYLSTSNVCVNLFISDF